MYSIKPIINPMVAMYLIDIYTFPLDNIFSLWIIVLPEVSVIVTHYFAQHRQWFFCVCDKRERTPINSNALCMTHMKLRLGWKPRIIAWRLHLH